MIEHGVSNANIKPLKVIEKNLHQKVKKSIIIYPSIFFRLCICCTLLCRFSNCKLLVQTKEGLQRLTQLGYSNYKCTCRWDMTGKLFLFIYYNVYLSHILNSSLIMSQKKTFNKIPKNIWQRKKFADQFLQLNIGLRRKISAFDRYQSYSYLLRL